MANAFLDRLRAMGLYGSNAAPMAGMEGIPPEMLEAAQRQSRLGIGAQLMAAGFARDPRARAEAIAGIGDAADISRPLYNMAQAKLMATPRERETRTDIVESDGRLLLIDLSTGEVIRDVGPAPNRGGGAGGGDLSKVGTMVRRQNPETGEWEYGYVQFGGDGTAYETQLPEGYQAVPPGDKAFETTAGQNRGKQTVQLEFGLPKAQTALGQRAAKDRLILQKIQSVRDRLSNDRMFSDTGLVGSGLSLVPGTDAYGLSSDMDTIKANLGFEELQDMRDASPTGGALGQVAVQELEMLQATKGKLDQGLSGEDLLNVLDELELQITRGQGLRKQAFERQYAPLLGGDAGAPSPEQGAASSAPPPLAQRVRGQVYQTPRGPMVWTGSGWAPAGNQ